MKRVSQEKAKKEEERKAAQKEKFERDLKKGGKTLVKCKRLIPFFMCHQHPTPLFGLLAPKLNVDEDEEDEEDEGEDWNAAQNSHAFDDADEDEDDDLDYGFH